jgi:acyl-CoA dehydrogenase
MSEGRTTSDAPDIAASVEKFVRGSIVPYERDPRWTSQGPDANMVDEMRACVRAAGLLTPHISAGGDPLSHRDSMILLRAAGLSPLGPTRL